MNRKELNRIGKKLNVNCGGEGGTMGPCPTVRDTYSRRTRTPAVKQKIRSLEESPVSYMLDKTPDEAMKEIAKVRKVHTNDLEHLQKVAAGKAEPLPHHESFWRAAEAKAGRVIPAMDWAKTLAVPQKQQYIMSLDTAEKVIKTFARGH